MDGWHHGTAESNIPPPPESVGAVVRLVNAAGAAGPARELHAGSGYWSQDSGTLVLGLPGGEEPTAVLVRWPGGRTTETKLPPGAREIRVAEDGTVKPVPKPA